jgi:hypothetical protein
MTAVPNPHRLSDVLAQYISVRGLARRRADTQLQTIWNEIAGERIAAETRVLNLRQGVLQIAVSNSSLLTELVSFQKTALLETIRKDHPDFQIRDLKFRLRGDLRQRSRSK